MLIKSSNYYYSDQQVGIDRKTKEFVVNRCVPYITGPNILDLGFVDDLWISKYLEPGIFLDIVEGADRHVEYARKLFHNKPNIRIYHAFFEEFLPDRKYNTIIAGDMLRYIHDDLKFLTQMRNWLENNGTMIITVPNSRSFHRRIGCLMGMISHPESNNERDLEVGNLRGYDKYSLRHLVLQSGYSIKEIHGCFLKPLSSSQIEHWDDNLLNAFLEIGDELEEYCWFLYAVCKK